MFLNGFSCCAVTTWRAGTLISDEYESSCGKNIPQYKCSIGFNERECKHCTILHLQPMTDYFSDMFGCVNFHSFISLYINTEFTQFTLYDSHYTLQTEHFTTLHTSLHNILGALQTLSKLQPRPANCEITNSDEWSSLQWNNMERIFLKILLQFITRLLWRM